VELYVVEEAYSCLHIEMPHKQHCTKNTKCITISMQSTREFYSSLLSSVLKVLEFYDSFEIPRTLHTPRFSLSTFPNTP